MVAFFFPVIFLFVVITKTSWHPRGKMWTDTGVFLFTRSQFIVRKQQFGIPKVIRRVRAGVDRRQAGFEEDQG